MSVPVSLRRRLASSLVSAIGLCFALVTAGCMDMESGVTFNKDLTGKATFKMTMDMEPFVMNMLQMQNKAQGKTSVPTAQELEAMSAGMMSQLGDGMIDVATLKNTLPPGVTLVDSNQTPEGLKLRMNFTFAFTDATKLPLIALSPNSRIAAAGATGGGKPLKPFESLEFTDEGATMLIASKAPAVPAAGVDPAKAKADALAGIDSSKAQLDQLGMGGMLQDMKVRVAFRFDVQFTVVEHNAPAKDGTTYMWEMKIDSLDSIDKLPTPPSMKLRFNKK